MPTTAPLRFIALILAGLLAVGVALSVITSTFSPSLAALVLVLGALPLRSPERIIKAKPLTLYALALVPVLAATSSLLLDSPWLWALAPVVAGVVVALVWRMIRRAFAPGELISYSLSHALEEAGVTLAEEATAGWTSGVTTKGAVVLVREIPAGQGPVESWPQLSALKVSASSTHQALAAQSITPHMIVVATGMSGLLHKTPWVTVVSPDRLANFVRPLVPSIVDPVALAKSAGITLSRDVARRVGRTSRPTPTPRPVHQGRVTPKKPRPSA